MRQTSLKPDTINPLLKEKESAPVDQAHRAAQILTRPNITLDVLESIPEIKESLYIYTTEVREQAEINIKYKGYIEKEKVKVEKLKSLENKKIPHRINRIGSMMSLHFSSHNIVDFETASGADILLFGKFFHHMLENGIYLPPSGYESWFLSNALSEENLNDTVSALKSFNS